MWRREGTPPAMHQQVTAAARAGYSTCSAGSAGKTNDRAFPKELFAPSSAQLLPVAFTLV